MEKKFICTVCGYIHEGAEAPEKCPLCGAPKAKFTELTAEAALTFVPNTRSVWPRKVLTKR